MHVEMPDPDPGRCLNHRSKWGRSYRCLGYENQRHECEFDIPKTDPSWERGGHAYSLEHLKPRPWVKP